MTVCRAYSTTPDVAARLLSPSLRDLTRACLDFERAQRLVAEFRAMNEAEGDAKAEIADRWRENNDGPFFAELLREAGCRQPRMDEV